MSNATQWVPKASKQRATGQAVVRLCGKDFYLGRFGSAVAKGEYDRLITEWLANGRQLSNPDVGLSVAELLIDHASSHRTCTVEFVQRSAWTALRGA
jgi:hypothetical protein